MSWSEPVKAGLRSLANLPRYGPVALDDPQGYMDVWLEGLGPPRNVTRNNVVSALRPFTIGIMTDIDAPVSEGQPVRLCMRDAASNRFFGSIGLRLASRIRLPEHQFCLFEMDGCENRCVSRASLDFYYVQKWFQHKLQQRRNPYNFRMTNPDLRASYVFYICPRPVVLVTVQHGESGNMFPMDLIGPTDSPWFSMALRKTSPAVRLMQESRQMALASIPFRYRPVVYEMGKHHKLSSIDWERLPFPVERSPLFGLPVAKEAFKVREVMVKECHEIGSHMLFLTTTENETPQRESQGGDRQLFHVFSSSRQYRSLGG